MNETANRGGQIEWDRTNQERKAEWLQHCGLGDSGEDGWLRARVAYLMDLDHPTDLQEHVLVMADVRLSLGDLPVGAWPNHKEELMALARAEMAVSCPRR